MSHRILIGLLFIALNIVYAQCDYSSELLCNLNEDCEWFEDISEGNCYYAFSSYSECIANGCSWYNPGTYGYMGSHCYGGTYTTDNSYCQEIEMPECSGLEEGTCNHPLYGEGCEWVEDIEIGDCNAFDNSESSCTSYPSECFWDEDITYASCNYSSSGACNSVEGCYWDCSDYGWYCDCYGQQQIIDTECVGQYEIDSSYCQEVELPECSDMNEIQCNGEDGCFWYEDIDSVSCGSLSASECSQYFDDGCSLDADCIQWGSWYTWICYEYGPQYCTGGDIDIDNSSCEEIQYQLGDINGDESINILDVIATVNLIQNGGYDLVVDIDSNGVINILDIIQLINIILDRS